MINEIWAIIIDEMEKVVSTAIGVFVSIVAGNAAIDYMQHFEISPIWMYAVELITKVSIAVVSGVCTYLSIYFLKKLLRHQQ